MHFSWQQRKPPNANLGSTPQLSSPMGSPPSLRPSTCMLLLLIPLSFVDAYAWLRVPGCCLCTLGISACLALTPSQYTLKIIVHTFSMINHTLLSLIKIRKAGRACGESSCMDKSTQKRIFQTFFWVLKADFMRRDGRRFSFDINFVTICVPYWKNFALYLACVWLFWAVTLKPHLPMRKQS